MSQQQSIQKSATQSTLRTFTDYGGQQRLVNYANLQRNLSPQAELCLAKDYNSKINKYVKQERTACTLPSECDSKTIEMCKENLNKIATLQKNNPTLKPSDPITQESRSLNENKSHIIKTPLSDVDNLWNFHNNPIAPRQNPNSKVNYQTQQSDWKPSQKSIQPAPAKTKDLFEKRELKVAESKPTARNPILEDNQTKQYGKHESYGKSDHLECKKLLSNGYGQELKYKEDKHMAQKPNSFQLSDRTFNYSTVNQGDYRKKPSEFENKNTFFTRR
ncbi:unnamed protein product [Paramecium octaurelia]|uniref:Uncharacterized protein n=1 Tax=Paramecium octaurelia TaxID=43137 RepID=A0A8S1VAI3_PAROT|nr:unnamed protein product [Paramecium octaurelia]